MRLYVGRAVRVLSAHLYGFECGSAHGSYPWIVLSECGGGTIAAVQESVAWLDNIKIPVRSMYIP